MQRYNFELMNLNRLKPFVRNSPDYGPLLVVELNGGLIVFHTQPGADSSTAIFQNEFLRLDSPGWRLTLPVSTKKDHARQKHEQEPTRDPPVVHISSRHFVLQVWIRLGTLRPQPLQEECGRVGFLQNFSQQESEYSD